MTNKNKIDYAQPQSIEEAINELQVFLECDLYTKFRPEHKLHTGKKGKMQKWYRQDIFLNEKEFIEYINNHLDILRKEMIKLIGKRRYGKNKM